MMKGHYRMTFGQQAFLILMLFMHIFIFMRIFYILNSINSHYLKCYE